jgi:hypothetical protein
VDALLFSLCSADLFTTVQPQQFNGPRDMTHTPRIQLPSGPLSRVKTAPQQRPEFPELHRRYGKLLKIRDTRSCVIGLVDYDYKVSLSRNFSILSSTLFLSKINMLLN